MDTSDGITDYEWDKVRELTAAIVNVSMRGEDPVAETEALFDYLDELEVRYGKLASLLATRADFHTDSVVAEALLREAYAMAKKNYDLPNQWHIADSLFHTQLSKEDSLDPSEAWEWLNVMEQLAETYPNPDALSDLEAARFGYRERWGS